MSTSRWGVVVAVGLVLAASWHVLGVSASNGTVRKFASYDEYIESVSDGKRVYLTAYKASWCGHCKRLAPIWEELATKVKGASNIVIAEVECPNHKKICDELGVKGFPTIMSSFAGEAKETYKGARTLESLEKFARSQAILWTAETTSR